MPHHPYAILFPGQGSQKIGMGQNFVGQKAFDEIIEQANQLYQGMLSDFIWEGTQLYLTQTEVAQPALLTIECGILKLLKEKLSQAPGYTLGHSLGEFSALVASEVLDFSSTFELVLKRSQLMQEACNQFSGTMTALLKADRQILNEVLAQPEYLNKIVIGNYNSAQQVVLSGEKELMPELIAALKAKGVKRTIPLKVSGAFHSPLMKEAAVEFAQVIDTFSLNDTVIPVITNVDAKPTTLASDFCTKLKAQLTAPVLWENSIEYIGEQGITHFIECGPGKTLSGLVKRILPESQCLNISELEHLDLVEGFLKKE